MVNLDDSGGFKDAFQHRISKWVLMDFFLR